VPSVRLGGEYVRIDEFAQVHAEFPSCEELFRLVFDARWQRRPQITVAGVVFGLCIGSDCGGTGQVARRRHRQTCARDEYEAVVEDPVEGEGNGLLVGRRGH
jgi:hypothetical protein